MTWLAVLTLVWLVVAALSLQAHQRGSARSARRWTTRLYAVTLVPPTALAVGGALVAVQLTFAGAGTDEAITAAAPYARWLAIVVNVVIVIRRREALPQVSDRAGARARARAGARVHESFTFETASSPRA